jgi:hypothetical protein
MTRRNIAEERSPQISSSSRKSMKHGTDSIDWLLATAKCILSYTGTGTVTERHSSWLFASENLLKTPILMLEFSNY